MRPFFVLVVVFGLTFVASTALPCSIDGCRDGELSIVRNARSVPGFNLSGWGYLAEVPENIPAILWRANENAWQQISEIPDPSDVLLSEEGGEFGQAVFSMWDGEVPAEVDFLERRTFVLVPDSPLNAGSNYLIADLGFETWRCGGPESGNFKVSAKADYPTTLGVLEMPETVQGWVDGTLSDRPNPSWMDLEIEDDASCTVFVGAAAVFVRFTPSEDAEPWKDAFYYRLFFDDKPWIYHPTSPMDIHDLLGVDATWSTLFAYCGAPVDRCEHWYPINTESADEWEEQFEYGRSNGIWVVPDPGVHTVRLQAWLPGTDIVLETPEIEIDIRCPERVELSCPDDFDEDVLDSEPVGDDIAGDMNSDSGCSVYGGRAGSGALPTAILLIFAVLSLASAGFSAVRSRRVRS